MSLVDMTTQSVLGPEVQLTMLTVIQNLLVESSDVTLQGPDRARYLTLWTLITDLQVLILLMPLQITAISETLITFIAFVGLEVSVNLSNVSSEVPLVTENFGAETAGKAFLLMNCILVSL